MTPNEILTLCISTLALLLSGGAVYYTYQQVKVSRDALEHDKKRDDLNLTIRTKAKLPEPIGIYGLAHLFVTVANEGPECSPGWARLYLPKADKYLPSYPLNGLERLPQHDSTDCLWTTDNFLPYVDELEKEHPGEILLTVATDTGRTFDHKSPAIEAFVKQVIFNARRPNPTPQS